MEVKVMSVLSETLSLPKKLWWFGTTAPPQITVVLVLMTSEFGIRLQLVLNMMEPCVIRAGKIQK